MPLEFLPQYQDASIEPHAHYYRINGVRHQRVTTALNIINKPALPAWAARVALGRVREILEAPDTVSELSRLPLDEHTFDPAEYQGFIDRLMTAVAKRPNEIRDESSALGTEVHALLRALAQGDNVSIPVEHQPAITGALAFLADYEITVCDTERVVWDDVQRIAGTVDGIGWRNGQLVIWDWKRSAHIYWETALQLAAYAKLLSGLTDMDVAEAFAVRLPRTAGETYEAKRISGENLVTAYGCYYSATDLYSAGKFAWWEET